jgi:hypothetical protein
MASAQLKKLSENNFKQLFYFKIGLKSIFKFQELFGYRL